MLTTIGMYNFAYENALIINRYMTVILRENGNV
jgi:hypothetical protein